MVQVNHAIIALSIALNIILAGALYSIISGEESPDPEIVFFERLDESLVEFDREDTIRLATFNIRTFGVTKMGIGGSETRQTLAKTKALPIATP